jgi:hypothetical protein
MELRQRLSKFLTFLKSLRSNPSRAIGFAGLLCFAYPLMTFLMVLQPLVGDPVSAWFQWMVWVAVYPYFIIFLYWTRVSVFKLKNHPDEKHLIWAEAWWCFRTSMFVEQVLIVALLVVNGLVGLYLYSEEVAAPFAGLIYPLILSFLVPMTAWMSLSIIIDMPRETGTWWSLLGSESLARVGLCEAENDHIERAQEFARSSLKMTSTVLKSKGYSLCDLVKCQKVLRLMKDLDRKAPQDDLKSMLQHISRSDDLANYTEAVSTFLSALRWPSQLNDIRDLETQPYEWLRKWSFFIGPFLPVLIALYSETVRSWLESIAKIMSNELFFALLITPAVVAFTYWSLYRPFFAIRLEIRDIGSLLGATTQP